MNASLLMGLFAFYVVGVSLVSLLADGEIPRLTRMKKVWGRSRGLALHFLAHVGLPMVFGIVFLSRGVAGFDLPADREPFSFEPVLSNQPPSIDSSLPLSELIEDLSLAYTGEDAASERFRHNVAAKLARPMDSLTIQSGEILLP